MFTKFLVNSSFILFSKSYALSDMQKGWVFLVAPNLSFGNTSPILAVLLKIPLLFWNSNFCLTYWHKLLKTSLFSRFGFINMKRSSTFRNNFWLSLPNWSLNLVRVRRYTFWRCSRPASEGWLLRRKSRSYFRDTMLDFVKLFLA